MENQQRICLIHYHEIGLKGHNRSQFEKRLASNLQSVLSDEPVNKIVRISGRLCMFLAEGCTKNEAHNIARLSARIPGVARVSCGFRCERDIELMKDVALHALQEVEDFESFKVQSRRNHTDFDINSMEMNQIIGGYLCANNPDKHVKMKNPDVEVRVEVVQGASYVSALSIKGVGGLPVGSAGKVVSLLSSGIDSPVASWRMARRGAVVIGVHFSGRPQTDASSEYLVDDIGQVLEQSGCIARTYIVPFGNHQRLIAESAPPELRVILYRRLMFRVAEALAVREGAGALVTGESLGQVASQTLDNINCTNAVVNLPVLRPLIGSDKLEIIEDAQALGSFDISSQDASDCCTLFMPRNPETHGKLSIVEEAEKAFDIEAWVEQLVEAAELTEYRCAAYKHARSKKD